MTDDFDWLALQRTAHAEFGRRVAAVSDWTAPTPDTEWDVRALVSHVIEEQQWVPYLLDGQTLEQAERQIEPLRDDLKGEWELYSFSASAAWRHTPGDHRVHLTYDTVDVAQYLREQVADVTIHTWDLARAIGADEHLDDELVRAVWGVFEPQRDTLAATGLYAPPVAVDDASPLQDRLIAVTGRDPRPATPRAA
ncbi:TIGR03086 family metal-binding protein [Galbitalea sp. SE-J8]|uniref:TIGR03086 family metal-binding protein n=1 Tax=Galbitalea sp. SE-J8 TaxID=3054952 RepID=UPI00259CD127|nr:TIGR03086 family metal-binding protein [Galbitalea sp. SE-J8]MDM4764191.1 TIGR03086 family metal-binding protein [Galbitalea sp. SE-J8]